MQISTTLGNFWAAEIMQISTTFGNFWFFFFSSSRTTFTTANFFNTQQFLIFLLFLSSDNFSDYNFRSKVARSSCWWLCGCGNDNDDNTRQDQLICVFFPFNDAKFVCWSQSAHSSCFVDTIIAFVDTWFTNQRSVSKYFWIKSFLGWSQLFLGRDSPQICQNGDKKEAYQPSRETVFDNLRLFWRSLGGCKCLNLHCLSSWNFHSYSLSSLLCVLCLFRTWEFFDRPPRLRGGLKEVLRVTTFCKVVPSTLWALTYNQVTNFCNLLSFFFRKL